MNIIGSFQPIKKLPMYLFILFLLSSSVNALTESEFVELLLDNAFFEKEQINLAIKQIEMQGDRDNYGNWEFEIGGEIGRINKSKNKFDYTSSTDYAKSTNQNVRKISTDLTKKFFSNGSELNISYDKSLPVKNEEMHDKNGYQLDKDTTEYLDDIEVSWTLPLLKNKNGVVDQKTYDLAVLDYKDEKLLLAEVKEDFIEDKLMIFLDWVGYKEQIRIVKNRLNVSKDILFKIKQADVNKGSILAMKRSIDKSTRIILKLESKLKAEQKSLSILLKSIDINKNPLVVNWDMKPNLINDLNAYCQTNVRDIQRIEIEKIQNNRYIKTYDNSQLPDLDFTITASKDDNKGNYSTYSKSSETEYEAKIEFSYPLTGDISNEVYLSKYRLKSRQLELKYQDKFDDVLSAAKKLNTEIKQGIKRLELYKSQINSIDVQSAELKEFLSGNGNIHFVIGELNDNQDLSIEYVIAAIDFHKSRVKYDSLLDRLFVSN